MSKLGNVKLRKNSGALIGARALMNLIEGANITITATDDPTGDEFDITIASAAAGGSIVVRKNTGADVGTQPRLNFIEGANIVLTIADDGGDSEIDITIAGPAAAESVWLDEFFPAVAPDAAKGAYPAVTMTDGIDTTIYQLFMIPDDITTITNAVVMVIPEGTGNLYWQCDTNGAACGEDFETNTDSIGATATGVTTDEIECIDISDSFTGFTAGDVVGLQFIRLGSNASDTVNADAFYLGVLIQGEV